MKILALAALLTLSLAAPVFAGQLNVDGQPGPRTKQPQIQHQRQLAVPAVQTNINVGAVAEEEDEYPQGKNGYRKPAQSFFSRPSQPAEAAPSKAPAAKPSAKEPKSHICTGPDCGCDSGKSK